MHVRVVLPGTFYRKRGWGSREASPFRDAAFCFDSNPTVREMVKELRRLRDLKPENGRL